MIVSRDTRPERKLYYIGSLAIDIMRNSPKKDFDFFDIFQKINNYEKISMNLFALTMDWLFLIGAINDNNGQIKKCF
ncbi:MAG: hypothetical protein A2Y10_03710 [Planctomycetes bacterium GWF2_41_51]|nr:MAG: hypothetical protein A2Y10_03710 [Planctomycetes bacterium GWF2_41_51]HBG28850.1 hypothetical protein [Phycisphaerales bacterium]